VRRLLAIAAGTLVVAAAPASGAPVELQGTMTVTTSTAGSVLVHIANRTPTFPSGDGGNNVTFSFAGTAALRELVVLAEAAGADGKRFVGYVDGSLEGDSGAWTATDIPAGDYRLYAVADGHATTITIKMPTGSGEAALPLSDPAVSDIHPLQAGAGGVFRAAGATTGAGVVFGAAEATFGPGQAGTAEFCEAVGDSANTDAPYGLGCSQGELFPAVGAGGFESIGTSTMFETPSAVRHGFGGNAQAVTPPVTRGAVAALTFTPQGTPGGPTSPVAPVGAVAARVVSTRVRVSKTGRAPVRVRCTGPGKCSVRLALSGSNSKGKATIPAGATRKVNVRLSSALRKRLKRSRSIRVTLLLKVTGQSGGGATVTRSRLTLTAPRR
jgi:hypothetical protein